MKKGHEEQNLAFPESSEHTLHLHRHASSTTLRHLSYLLSVRLFLNSGSALTKTGWQILLKLGIRLLMVYLIDETHSWAFYKLL